MLSSIITDITDQLEEFSANWWFLLVILVIAGLDSVLPIVPGETMVIVGGVAAGQGNQWLPLVILAGATGAFLGDNLAYLIGRHFSERVEGWAAKTQKRRDRLDAAAYQIHLRGGLLLITARFIPGGRSLLTISSGLTNQPWGWFAKWIAIATTIWASYAALLGYVFGQAFEDNHAAAFWLAFAAALVVTGLIELIRWLRNRYKTAGA